MSSLLEQCIARVGFYQNVGRLRQDMQMLLYNCSTLKPSVGVFQSNSGNITLFYLTGVVPINYQGAQYNIPVSIYVDPPYPNQPPRVFVTPTPEMVVKQNHKSVDMNGRVYLPQLSQWNPHSSSLVDVVGILSSVFSAEPPVVSVRKPPSNTPTVMHAVGTIVSRRASTTVGIPARADVLRNSLTVKVRAKLPAVLKTEVDALNEGRKAEFRMGEKVGVITRLLADVAETRRKLDASISKMAALEAATVDWVSKNREENEATVEKFGTQKNALSFLEADSAVGQQVIDLLAEECAIEDLLDSLAELTRRGKLSASDLTREVRLLTRKLFEVKFLRKKTLVVLQVGGVSARSHIE